MFVAVRTAWWRGTRPATHARGRLCAPAAAAISAGIISRGSACEKPRTASNGPCRMTHSTTARADASRPSSMSCSAAAALFAIGATADGGWFAGHCHHSKNGAAAPFESGCVARLARRGAARRVYRLRSDTSARRASSWRVSTCEEDAGAARAAGGAMDRSARRSISVRGSGAPAGWILSHGGTAL